MVSDKSATICRFQVHRNTEKTEGGLATAMRVASAGLAEIGKVSCFLKDKLTAGLFLSGSHVLKLDFLLLNPTVLPFFYIFKVFLVARCGSGGYARLVLIWTENLLCLLIHPAMVSLEASPARSWGSTACLSFPLAIPCQGGFRGRKKSVRVGVICVEETAVAGGLVKEPSDKSMGITQSRANNRLGIGELPLAINRNSEVSIELFHLCVSIQVRKCEMCTGLAREGLLELRCQIVGEMVGKIVWKMILLQKGNRPLEEGVKELQHRKLDTIAASILKSHGDLLARCKWSRRVAGG